MTQRPQRLLKDPCLPWTGDFPYTRLAERLRSCGCRPVTPSSSGTEIKAAFFDLMEELPDASDRRAWDELRLVERRLIVDFFLYPMPEGDEWIEVPPFALEVKELVHMVPDAEAIVVPEPPDLGAAASLLAVDVHDPADVGFVDVDVAALLGGRDE